MSDIWNAKTYTKFIDLRTRPAKDLLSVIPDSFQPQCVYDLGCGPGNSTVILKLRWPNAKVLGLDSSSDMLTKAQVTYPDIAFIEQDIAHFVPEKKVDCLFANASLQWLPNHQNLLPSLFQHLNEGGIFAIQMPNNFHAPTHQTIINVLKQEPQWQTFIDNLFYKDLTKPFYNLPYYYDLFINAGAASVQLWETEYFQEMPDYKAIFAWVSGTGLRPILASLSKQDQERFANEYISLIAKAYPLQTNQKVLLPFRRVFIVAVKAK